jgi:hypothetical protein
MPLGIGNSMQPSGRPVPRQLFPIQQLLHAHRNAARLQTLDHGAPVSVYTVSRERGHGSEDMVRRVYAHLGAVRHRSGVVEYRIDQHLEALKDRLGNVGFVTRSVTRMRQAAETKNPATPKYRRGKIFQSGPGATRTRDLLLRRQALYPTELRTRNHLALRTYDSAGKQCRTLLSGTQF